MTLQQLSLLQTCDNLRICVLHVFHVVVNFWLNHCTVITYYACYKEMAGAKRQAVWWASDFQALI